MKLEGILWPATNAIHDGSLGGGGEVVLLFYDFTVSMQGSVGKYVVHEI